MTIHARTEINHWGRENCEQVRQVIQALLVLINRGMTIGTPDVVTAIYHGEKWGVDKFPSKHTLKKGVKDNFVARSG